MSDNENPSEGIDIPKLLEASGMSQRDVRTVLNGDEVKLYPYALRAIINQAILAERARMPKPFKRRPPPEPKRDDFRSETDFSRAHDRWAGR